ncbi:MAG: AAA family ATPase [Leptolyngbya sp. SIOISBB]|nr:AAA family ATPase [Leptolyngbya sp. SIOISBB]
MVAENKCFPSLLSLRVTHSELLKRHQAQGDESETLTLIAAFIHKAKATGTIIDDEEERSLAQGFLDYWSAILYRAGQEPPEATLYDFDPQLAPKPDDSQCPYVGLKPYRESEQALFYGRQPLVRQLLQTVDTERLLLVTGARGVGKTSVVFGGLLPKLRARTLSNRQHWLDYSWMAPGSSPFEVIARLLCPERVDKEQLIPRLTQYLRQHPGHLRQIVNRIGQGKPAVLVIDQFEELFTLCHDKANRQICIASLLKLVQTPEPQHTVIIILKSEYESQLADFPELAAVCRSARIPVMSPSADELHTMITQPADLVGLKFEAGVVDALVQDTLREPECLSLLQVILTRLWEKRNRNRITWQHYRDVGRGRQALVTQAEQCFAELSPDEQAIARQLLLGLVQLGNGMNLVKRRVPRQLLTKIVANASTEELLQPIGQTQTVDNPDAVATEAGSEPAANPEVVEQLLDSLFTASEPPAAVQQHFQTLLQERMTSSDTQPPLFPWETTLAEYPTELAEAPTQPWLAQLRSLPLPTALPDDVLSGLLDCCQQMIAESLQPGIQLVRAVENLFPDQPQTMDQIAGLVLANATVRNTATRDVTALKAAFPNGYAGANPQQQVTLTMLAAKDILDTLTLTLTPEIPTQQREWLTTTGILYLKAMLVRGDRLRILAQLPCGGSIHIQNGQDGLAKRSSPGLLVVELNHPQADHHYSVEVALADQDETSPLRFAVSILSSQP